MAVSALRKLYAPEFFVKESLRIGDLPDTKTAYKVAFGIAWASIAEMFLMSLVSIADTVMVSTVGEVAIAAVGLVLQPRFIVQTMVLSLNVAVTSLTARRKGEQNMAGAVSSLKQGLILSTILSILLSLIAYPLAGPILQFAGAQADTIDIARVYFQTLLMGLPFINLSLTICAAQRGIGRTQVSMRVNMTTNIVNVIFNYLLIGGNLGFPRLEAFGAAVATCIGWVCGFLMAVISVSHPQGNLFIFSRRGWKFDKRTVSSMYKVASGSFVEQMCMRTGFLLYAKVVAGLGTLMMATHQICISLLSLSFSFGEGFSIASTSLVGQNMGAKRPDLSIMYGKVCQRMSFISSGIVFVIFITCGEFLISLFSSDPAVTNTGENIMLVMGIIVFAQASQMIFMGSLRGAGDTRYTAIISLVSVMLLRPISGYIFAYPLGLGLVGAWLGFLLDQYLRLVLTQRRFSSGKWMGIEL